MRFIKTLSLLIHAQAALAGYQVISSAYGNNQVRLKSWSPEDKSLCDGGSKHHTGWADIGKRHIFFWFHEARRGIKDAPLLIWLQGGPGGSALAGMFLEHGPCLINTNVSTTFNPYSWTETFNVIYVDQPAGVGFSYVDGNEEILYPRRAEDSTLDLVTFIKLFYEVFPEIASADLHVGGESYGGRFVPLLGSKILEFNERVPHERDQIPLRSLLLGNGWTSPRHVVPSWYDVACYEYRGYPPHLSKPVCDYILPLVDTCKAALEACAATRDTDICVSTNFICKEQFADIMEKNTTRSAFDRRLRNCDDGETCLGNMTPLLEYLNSPRVFDLLDIVQSTGGLKSNWPLMDLPTANRFLDSGDYHFPSTRELENVLNHAATDKERNVERPVDVLYYVGVADIVCNPVGVQETLESLHWLGDTEFHAKPWVKLPYKTAAGNPAGRVKSVQTLTLLELEEAGHMVPLDQPETALHMVKDWLRFIETGVSMSDMALDSLSTHGAGNPKFVVQEL